MTNPLRSIRGSVVLVTGAASGMGRATARLFGEEGAHVAVTDVNAAGAEAVAGEILAAGGSARAWAMDVGDAASIAEMIAAVGTWHDRSTWWSTTPESRVSAPSTARTRTPCGSGSCGSTPLPSSA